MPARGRAASKPFGTSFARPTLDRRSVPDDHFRPDRHALEKIDHVAIGKPKASRGDGVTDRFRLVGAVYAVDGRAEIKRASAHWIPGAASHETRQVGLPRNHLGRRCPVWPFRFP